MNVYELILRKRNGGRLRPEEIKYLVEGYARGTIPDYQMAAWAMAVFFQGMSPEETTALTEAMAASGERIDLRAIDGVKVDKHSTGGVGDTTTLVLAPLVAACGAPVAKMSGRALGHTGGTLDKLESIPGFRVDMDAARFIESVNRLKVAVIGQTAALAPADGRLYALRDVTATVESIPLIAASIMSKKLAAGADAFVLDVKSGRGAFLQTLDESLELARTMVAIGQAAGRETVALVTDMDKPLGRAVGNSLEMREAVAALRGEGPEDLKELVIALGAEMLMLGRVAADGAEARERLTEAIGSGSAATKLKQLIENQGGDPRVVDEPERLEVAPEQVFAAAPAAGFVVAVDGVGLGLAANELGAGRKKTGDRIDHGVGLLLEKNVGDRVEKGEPLCRIFARTAEAAAQAAAKIEAAYEIGPAAPAARPLVLARVGPEDV